MMLSKRVTRTGLVAVMLAAIFCMPLGMNICLAGDANSGTAKGPVPGVKALDAAGHMQISPQDRCAVCAMMPAKYPKFASAIQLESGETYYFCGTGCMIRTWMNPDVFLNASGDDLKRCVVRDYFSGAEIDGQSAHWVAGSDVVGPMGPALVPLKSADDVEVFRNRHGGKSVFRMQELNDARWEEITGKKAVP
jgi:copper chaperone NosL